MKPPASKSVEFEGHGGHRLAGVLHPAAGKSRGSIVQAHCFTCTKDYKIQVWLARELASRGFHVFRFDFAGLGQSEGEFAKTTLTTYVEDLTAAYRWIEDKKGEPVTLVGHSIGGAAAILATVQLEEVEAVITLGTSIHIGRRISKLLPPERESELAEKGVARVKIGGRKFPISKELLEDLERHSLVEALESMGRPLLVLHGTDDEVVPVAGGLSLFKAAGQPKAFVAFPGADHLFMTDRDLAPRMAAVICAWLEVVKGGGEP